ncbi:MAG: ABC transporter ATP-binding protein [Thermoplasmata archaeon]|nr:ABC transporter ATP-binding protein [Thermoplasmata archaeon]
MSEKRPAQRLLTITSKDITVRFGKITALDKFTVNVPSGVVGLLGPNGAGKSTFIKALLGLLRPENGKMIVAGYDPLTETSTVRDMIGYMPEHDCLIEEFNAVDLVSYLGQISGMMKRDAIPRSHEVLDFVGIGEERYRTISSYSTGMKQRVKLAQAIVHDPAILFLDEPTNGMDPQGREDMMELIRKISLSDKTILVSSHILDDLERVSDHIVIMNDGRLITEGSIDDLLAKKDGQKMVKVRGIPENMETFIKALAEMYEIRSVVKGRGEISAVVINKGPGNPVFKLSRDKGVQLRGYYPERATLEDVFIGTVEQNLDKEKGGGPDVN